MRVAKDVADLCGIERLDDHIVYVRDRAFNDQRYHIDSTKLRSLGWEPRVSWSEGLKKTFEWYSQDRSSFWDKDMSQVLVAHPVDNNNNDDSFA